MEKNLEKIRRNKKIILKKTQEFFLNSKFLTPKIGCELEFFLLDETSRKPANQGLVGDFIFDLCGELKKKFPLFYQVEKEQGASQIELKTIFTSDLSRLCEEIDGCKKFIKNLAAEKKLIASFAAQPFANDCGSALQFNISLHDEGGKNIFESDKNILHKTASTLLHHTNSMMIFLSPKTEDYERFSFALNRNLFQQGKFTAPVNLSFGADNRTCAIRIPSTKETTSEIVCGKRLEYRVAAADADPTLCISAILLSISDGLLSEKNSFAQIFGNAFDEQYQLQKICESVEDAVEEFLKEGNFIRKNFEEFLR